MDRRSFTLALAALPLASAARGQASALADVSAYLAGIGTAQGRFRQGNPDGSVSSGTLYIRRPGLMRFEYDPPVEAVVIADGTWFAVVDKASNAEPQRYPISTTPLRLLLAEDIDLTTSDWVQSVTEGIEATYVTAADPNHPERGSLRLGFTMSPPTLREWAVVDGSGQSTIVVLDSLETGMDLERGLFSIELAAFRR